MFIFLKLKFNICETFLLPIRTTKSVYSRLLFHFLFKDMRDHLTAILVAMSFVFALVWASVQQAQAWEKKLNKDRFSQ